MKKLIILILMIIISYSLMACEPEMYNFNDNEWNEDIISVDLILYSSENILLVDSIDEIADFEFESMTTLDVLDLEKLENFIEDFSNIIFLKGFSHLNTPNGIGVKINYVNGDFLIITDDLSCEECQGGDAILYNSEGYVINYFGGYSDMEKFINLINHYFNYQV